MDTKKYTFPYGFAPTLTAILAIVIGHGERLHAESKLFSDFNDGVSDWDGEFNPNNGVMTFAESNGRLTLTANFTGATEPGTLNTFGNVSWNQEPNLELQDNQALELRVDLVSINQDNVNAVVGVDMTGGGYYFVMRRNAVFLGKNGDGAFLQYFSSDEVTLKNENVVLVLSLMRTSQDLLLTGKILDKDANEAVLFERTVTDTPAKDPTTSGPFVPVAAPDTGPVLSKN